MSENSSQNLLSLSSATYNGPVFGPQGSSDNAEVADGAEFESPEEIAQALSRADVETSENAEPVKTDELDYGNVKRLIEQLSGEPVDDDIAKLAESGASVAAVEKNKAETAEKSSDYLWSDDEDAQRDVVVDSSAQSDPQDSDADKKVRTESFKIMANVGNFGLFLIVALIFTYVIGGWFDSLFETKPVFRVLWMAVGVIASFRELYRNIKAAQKLAESKEDR